MCGRFTNKEEKPLKKPWKLMTNVEELRDAFRGAQCTLNHEHAENSGDDCKKSEEYTAEMVRKIHRAWKLQIQHQKYKSSKDKLLTEFAPRLNLKQDYLCCSCVACPTLEQREILQQAQSTPLAEDIDWDNIPRMPRQKSSVDQPHRPKIPDFDPISHVAVARPVFTKEIARESEAREALDTE